MKERSIIIVSKYNMEKTVAQLKNNGWEVVVVVSLVEKALKVIATMDDHPIVLLDEPVEFKGDPSEFAKWAKDGQNYIKEIIRPLVKRYCNQIIIASLYIYKEEIPNNVVGLQKPYFYEALESALAKSFRITS